MAIRVSIFDNNTKTFGDMLVGDYFIQNEMLYCKIKEVYNTDNDVMYNAFCVDTGELVEFINGEGGIAEVEDMDIAVHL